MKSWLSQHWATLGLALGRLAASPLSTLLTALVIGVALSLPATLYLVLDNVSHLAGRLDAKPELTLFLSEGADRAALERTLGKRRELAQHRFVSRQEALAGLEKRGGLKDVVALLGANPLPDAFVLTPRDTDPAALERLRAELATLPGVASATLDTAWARRLAALLALGRDFVAVLAALFATALVAVSFNTIRLQVLAHREEIEVSRLLGATEAFVRRPFLYLGALQGLLGALVALGLVGAAVVVLASRVLELAAAYGVDFPLTGIAWKEAAALLGTAAALGWLGAWLATTEQLRRL
jgi:cell division transport system permease protein